MPATSRTAGKFVPVSVRSVSQHAAASCRELACARIASKAGQDGPRVKEGNMAVFTLKVTMREESLYGSGRRITAFTMLKMAVLAPMPRARVRTATQVK